MDVLKILATADPIRTKALIAIDFSDLKISSDESQNVVAIRRRKERAFIVASVAACAAMVVLLSFVTSSDQTTTPVNFSKAQQSAANFAEKQSQFAQRSPRVLLNHVLKRDYQSAVSENEFSPSPTSGQLTSSSMSWRYDQSTSTFGPRWEATVDFSSKGAMLASLGQQALGHILSRESQQQWIAEALNSLIVSETAAPAQRFMALAVSQTSSNLVLDSAPWQLRNIDGQKIWVRETPSGFALIKYAVDPNIPGIWVTARYRLSTFADPYLYSYTKLHGWAVVSEVSGNTLAENQADLKLFDLSKL